jgi:hypothetical protein
VPTAARSGRRSDQLSSGSHRLQLSIGIATVALEIVDTLHAGRIHPCPGGVERARQIDGPASGLNKHGIEAEPARVHSGKMDAIIGSESNQEDSPQTAVAQITRKASRRAPVIFKNAE